MNTPGEWEEGDRVLAPWEPQWLYPGTIRCIDDDVAFVKFDDGDRALIPLADLQSIKVQRGTKVYARWNKGPQLYYAAEVINALGEEILLRYEDGREERTSVSYVRVPRSKSALGPLRN